MDLIHPRQVWEASLEGRLFLNGDPAVKKSSSVRKHITYIVNVNLETLQVAQGDVVEVVYSSETKGRVVVKEIGARTRKGGYHLNLVRYKSISAASNNDSIE